MALFVSDERRGRTALTHNKREIMMRIHLLCLLLLIALHAVYSADDDAAGDDNVQTDDAYGLSSQLVVPCEKGIVQVTGISLLCNSPYTYYWGNGANRNSLVCDYGDKAQIVISFTVTDDLDGDIYMLMAASYQDEQLYLGESVELCYNYVGDSCSAAGDYTFQKKIQFAYVDGSYEKFVPTLEIAFSDSNDGSYSLGGVNIYCDEQEEEQEDQQDDAAGGSSGEYVDWTASGSNTQTRSRVSVFFMNYGILVGTVVVVTGFSLFLWFNNKRDGGSEITASNKQGLLA